MPAARREFCGPGKLISTAAMQDLDAQIEDAKAADNRVLKKALKQKYPPPPPPSPFSITTKPTTPSPPPHPTTTKLTAATRGHHNRRETLLITARNEHVTARLQGAYASRAGGRLDVFCVSNRWYAKAARKADSGVPALRRFCYAVTADAQLREARWVLAGRVVGLVGEGGLWVGGRLGALGEGEEGGGGGGGGDCGEVWRVAGGMVSRFFLFLLYISLLCGRLVCFPLCLCLCFCCCAPGASVSWYPSVLRAHHCSTDGRVCCGSRRVGGRFPFVFC